MTTMDGAMKVVKMAEVGAKKKKSPTRERRKKRMVGGGV
jgi:hypothetical protein